MCHCLHKCNTIGLSSLCIAPAFVPKVEFGMQADVPKVELSEQRVLKTLFNIVEALFGNMVEP